MIEPTVGRVVWYHDGNLKSEGHCAAIIAHVFTNELVNLSVFDINGNVHPVTQVYLWQGEGDRPNRRYAEWMPYQKGQAAKTEQLEKQQADSKKAGA